MDVNPTDQLSNETRADFEEIRVGESKHLTFNVVIVFCRDESQLVYTFSVLLLHIFKH